MLSVTRLLPLSARLSLGLLLSATGSAPQTTNPTPSDATGQQAAFPASTALAEGLSPESLAKLGELVQSFVEEGEVVGAELLVIKNGHSILHEGFGQKDKEANIAMGTGNVFCVRSMTKPLIGTAILMLADENKLQLEDLLSKYLPNFDRQGLTEITLAQLITHTSGMPMSQIISAKLTDIKGIQAVAELGSHVDLEFAPGTGFNYSDQGTDTLTAVIEVVSGMPAADFVRTRILEPLGMQHSTCVMDLGHPLRELGCSKYSGSRGHWNKFWSTDDAPLFPFFLGSQGLYASLEDYARFMELWLKRGRSRQERLLRARSVRRALVPNKFSSGWPTGLGEVTASYGQLMQLWSQKPAPSPGGKLVAFGHNGSDGTHAWVFPEQKAMVFYFTQSRGTQTGVRVEEALAELFLGVPFDPAELAPPLDEFLGYYASGPRSRYRAIIRDGKDLALELPGEGIMALAYAGADAWKVRSRPGVQLVFERSESGAVSGFLINGQHALRFEPSAEFPSPTEISKRVAQTHRLDLLETLGPLLAKKTLRIDKLDITGESESLWCWPNRFRNDNQANGNFDRFAFDGERVWIEASSIKRNSPEGEQGAALRSENPFHIFGDLIASYPKLRVIQRIEDGEREVFLLRAGDTSSTAPTFFVDWTSGRLMRRDQVAYVNGMGRLGQQATFSDFRDVEGMLLPFKTSVKLANSMIGSVVTTINSVELGVEIKEGTFDLTDETL